MKRIDCEFAEEVLAAVIESRWPENADDQLRVHVPACAICRETAMVAEAIGEARDAMRSSVAIPDSGRVWRMAQIRARREAIAAASRPITFVQMIAFACATGLLGACFGATSEWFQAALKRFASNPLTTVIAHHVLLAGATAAVLLLLPAAAYFVVREN
jgi:predicted anti-sigma-YlaC factor YlaD